MTDFQAEKDLVRAFYTAMDAAPASGAASVMAQFCAPDLVWRGFHPVNEQHGPAAVADAFWQPLKTSLTRMQRRLDIFFAGRNENDGYRSVWVASMGHLMGLFDVPWLGIRPTGRIAMLRYAAFHRVEAGQIHETAMFFDIPHLMIQAGQNPFPPQTGAHLVQPGPMTHDGLLFGPTDPAEGARTKAALDGMLADIGQWKGGSIDGLVAELRRTWNDDMIWWGPAGIGATYTIKRYAAQHSGPFRLAFRDRKFNGHLCRMAEGHFAGFFGWPNLTLTHAGGFMGLPGSTIPADMRVIDLYRRSGDKLTENWVFIDVLHWLNMQGDDVLARMADMQRYEQPV